MMAKKASGEPASAGEGLSAAERIDALFAFRAACEKLSSLSAKEYGEGRAVVLADPAMRAAIVREIISRLEAEPGAKVKPSRKALEELLVEVLVWSGDDDEPSLAAAADYAARLEKPGGHLRLIIEIQDNIHRLAAKRELAEPTRDAVVRLAGMIRGQIEAKKRWPVYFHEDEREEWLEHLEAALGVGVRRHLDPGEAWSDVAIADIEGLPAGPARSAWLALLAQCKSLPKSGKPPEKWLKDARQEVDRIGPDDFKRAILRWFPLVDRPRTSPHPNPNPWDPDWTNQILPHHANILRGLVFLCAGLDDKDVARALAKLTVSSYRKLPGIGPRLVSLGNACVGVLGTLPGVEAVGQLAVLKTRIKHGTAQKEVEKAFDAAAKRENLPREAIEELGVPAYGMEEVGRRVEAFGDYRAEMAADDDGFSIRWSKADGSPLKSVPASIKKDHAEEWKELQASAKDAGMMLTSRRDALDASYLARKAWSLGDWRERYLDHPLVGVIARRLIWTFTDGEASRDGLYHDGKFVDRDGRAIEVPDASTVALWHPIGHPVDEVTAWRDRLEQLGVKQPFKQAHREVYLLTDAERRTETYSNRFAAHILKQYQFHALCAARGWKNQLRLGVDDSYPPASRPLPHWGLRAEFWIEGIGDEHTESGAYLYLSTDQVRFYPEGAAQALAHASGGGYRFWRVEDRPLSLEDVPPLVFSEVMRDADLFVGVASVGNDPTWADGGVGGRHRDYWEQFSFGALSATAQTRMAVLERIIPRLKIADRCRFTDKFLVVRGDLRTYKIHLGSGNILMEPNDQYLCIVPKSAKADPGGKVFLPFEGDGVLSIILSKALLLADDRKIKDETITRQIVPEG